MLSIHTPSNQTQVNGQAKPGAGHVNALQGTQGTLRVRGQTQLRGRLVCADLQQEVLMISADEAFNGTFPFAPHYSSAPGFRMHYVDEGRGDPVVCLHGEPTWGYIYRKFIPPLSRSYRLIVPDHMGFGKSETPQDREYTLRTHVDNLEKLLLELDLTKITLVMQDWGGPIGAGFACRHPDRVQRLCLVNTVMPLGLPLESELFPKNMESEWFRWVRKSHEDGSFEDVLGHLGVTFLSVMKRLGLENNAVIDETWIDAYSAHFRTRQDCIGAIDFPLDFALDRAEFQTGSREQVEAVRRKPAMLAEGMKDKAVMPEIAISHFRAAFPHGAVVQLENAGHYCQEDAPDTLVALIEQFMQLT